MEKDDLEKKVNKDKERRSSSNEAILLHVDFPESIYYSLDIRGKIDVKVIRQYDPSTGDYKYLLQGENGGRNLTLHEREYVEEHGTRVDRRTKT